MILQSCRHPPPIPPTVYFHPRFQPEPLRKHKDVRSVLWSRVDWLRTHRCCLCRTRSHLPSPNALAADARNIYGTPLEYAPASSTPRALETASTILTHNWTAGNATAPATDALPLSGTHDAAAPPASSRPLNVP